MNGLCVDVARNALNWGVFMSVNCPACGSTSVKKSSAVYEQGFRKSQSQSTGIGLGSRGRIGVGIATTVGSSRSLAAEKNAPPTPEAGMAGVVAGFFAYLLAVIVLEILGVGFFESLILALLIALAAGIYVGHRSYSGDQRRDQARQSEYWHQWYCLRCGRIFIYDPPQLPTTNT